MPHLGCRYQHPLLDRLRRPPLLSLRSHNWRAPNRTEGLEINGYRINRSGGFIIANNAGIWHWDGAHRTTLIASEVDGSKCQMNDCVSDPAGRLFAGSL